MSCPPSLGKMSILDYSAVHNSRSVLSCSNMDVRRWWRWPKGGAWVCGTSNFSSTRDLKPAITCNNKIFWPLGGSGNKLWTHFKLWGGFVSKQSLIYTSSSYGATLSLLFSHVCVHQSKFSLSLSSVFGLCHLLVEISASLAAKCSTVFTSYDLANHLAALYWTAACCSWKRRYESEPEQ